MVDNEINLNYDLVREIISVDKREGKVPAIQFFRDSLAPFQYMKLRESKDIVDKILAPDWDFRVFKGNRGHQYLRIKY